MIEDEKCNSEIWKEISTELCVALSVFVFSKIENIIVKIPNIIKEKNYPNASISIQHIGETTLFSSKALWK